MLLYRSLLITAVTGGLMLAQDPNQKERKPADQRTPSTDRSTSRDQQSTSRDQQSTSRQSDTSKSTLSAQDKKFIQETAKNGHKEVELGKMAVEKASNDQVKSFGQRLVDDHTKMNRELEDVAKRKGVMLEDHSRHETSSTSGASSSRQSERQGEWRSGDEKRKSADAGLARMSGAQFDRAWLKQILDAHERTIKNFDREMNSTTDSDLRNFVSSNLPTVKEHRDQAKSLMASVGSDTGASRSTTKDPGSQRSTERNDRTSDTDRTKKDTDPSGAKKRNQ